MSDVPPPNKDVNIKALVMSDPSMGSFLPITVRRRYESKNNEEDKSSSSSKKMFACYFVGLAQMDTAKVWECSAPLWAETVAVQVRTRNSMNKSRWELLPSGIGHRS